MKVKVKYLGKRADTLKAVKMKGFRGPAVDFTKGVADMDEKDAEILITRSPRGFELVPAAEKPAAEKPA